MPWQGGKLLDPKYTTTPWNHPQLDRENVKNAFPCFGHFDLVYCYNLGIINQCPLKRLCMKEKELADMARKGKISHPDVVELDYSSRSIGSDKDRRRNLRDLEITRKRKAEREKKNREIFEELHGIKFIRK